MSVFKCKMCGGTIDFEPGATVGVCEYCGTKQTLPHIDDERKANLYDRANHFRRANDYDKAMAIYEQILDEDTSDAEAYWSLVLCRYGIEYVEDPTTHKRVPTVNRVQYTSIFADEDYKAALSHADTYQQVIYEQEAKAIDEIQKGILAISEKEEPFDIFICYKETDNNGRRTEDSVLAYDIYKELTKEGYKVFFSRVTLEDKLGTAYEPYIFAALNSAKIMIAIGTKAEYYNAVWVKNEWSRYLALIKKGQQKTLIPAYKGMDPYDLPEEFSHLQGQDMGKLGFMQDLVRGVKKILGESEIHKITDTEVAPLIDKANKFLKEKDWESAKEYFERVLDIDARNVKANLGILLVDMKVTKEEELSGLTTPFDVTDSYKRAVRYAEEELVNRLKGYNEDIRKRISEKKKKGTRTGIICVGAVVILVAGFFLMKMVIIPSLKYAKARRLWDNEQYTEAMEIYAELGDYQNSKNLLNECQNESNYAISYQKGVAEFSKGNYETAEQNFKNASSYKDSAEKVIECNKILFEAIYDSAVEKLEERDYDAAYSLVEQYSEYSEAVYFLLEIKYQRAFQLVDSGEYKSAIELLSSLGDYKDASSQITNLTEKYGTTLEFYELLSKSFSQAKAFYTENYESIYISEEQQELVDACLQLAEYCGTFCFDPFRISSEFYLVDSTIYWRNEVLSDANPFNMNFGGGRQYTYFTSAKEVYMGSNYVTGGNISKVFSVSETSSGNNSYPFRIQFSEGQINTEFIGPRMSIDGSIVNHSATNPLRRSFKKE